MTVDNGPLIELRKTFVTALERGDLWTAIRTAKSLLQQWPQVSQWSFISKAVRKLGRQDGAMRTLKVALLSSFSSDFIHDPLTAYAFVEGIHVEIYQPGFGLFRQEILNPSSGLYAFKPDVVILAIEGQAWAPALYSYPAPSRSSDGTNPVEEVKEAVSALIRALRERSEVTILIHNLFPPVWKRLGILDAQKVDGQTAVVHRINDAVSRISEESRGVYVVDYDGLVAQVGSCNWFDERMQHYAKAPIAQAMLRHLAQEYVKFFRALTGKSKKCLVLDLDNTLWGGVVGEDGLQGIQLSTSYPGSAYMEFQQAILSLHQRGILLAIASKNNEKDTEAVFSSHAHMVLKKEHFAVTKINWNAKSQSIMEIAKELNIGLDHIVFVDDNPAECELVSKALPTVTVISLGTRPEHFTRRLLEGGVFDTLTLSLEDQRRAELYRQRASVEALRLQSGTLEEFYRGLEMTAVFAAVDRTSLPRAAQLTQKTNQFNATTIRYTEAELGARMDDPGWLLVTVKVEDRFGDHGIVGLLVAHVSHRQLEIDTFLLSCRVIGRTVETAMLAYLAREANVRGATRLLGRIVPSAKNQPVRDLFERHGFQRLSPEGEDQSIWQLDTSHHDLAFPEWIRVVSVEHVSQWSRT